MVYAAACKKYLIILPVRLLQVRYLRTILIECVVKISFTTTVAEGPAINEKPSTNSCYMQ